MSGNSGDQVIKMNAKHRRLIQTLTVAVLVAYTTLLAYQTLSRGDVNRAEVCDVYQVTMYLHNFA